MNRRSDIDGDGAKVLAGTNTPPPAASPRDVVVPLRRVRSSSGLAAGGDPPSSPAPFVPVGEAVAAVVLRLRGGFPRVKSLVQTGGDDLDQL